MPAVLALDDLHTINDLAALYPRFLSVATLRWQLRHRTTNGLAPACVQIGAKLLISKPLYEAWLATQAEVAA